MTDDKAPAKANTPPEDENLCCVCLLASVVRTNQDYGLSLMVFLPDSSAAALATFGAVELQAPTFFASRFLMRTGKFSGEDLPICFYCLRWNLMAPFLWYNRNCWTRCGHCSYIQHARCKDVSLGGLS